MRRKARVLRPSFQALSWWELLRVPVTEYAIPLARVGSFRVWMPIEEMAALFGRPRRGKTGQLVHWLLDAPGPALVTSTKRDLYDLTHALREDRGPTYVFNPTGLGDLPSTIAFDPLVECEDAARAEERATDLISGGVGGRSDGEGKRWDDQAQRVLTGLLHAAALRGLTMTDVLRWVANPDTGRREVMSSLRRSPCSAAFVLAAEQFFETNDRTRSSITHTIMPCLGWLTNPTAVAATVGATPFDIRRALADQATVYLLGKNEGRVAPLLAALTGYIAREARRIAADSDGGRLDPPFRLILDEAANICPVPLDEWSSDFGSHGLTLLPAFQSRAQVVGRWGTAGADMIANNTGATVLHAYGSATTDLQHFVTLSGHREEPAGQSDATRPVPVISLTQLTTLPRGQVVLWPPETAVTLGRVRPGWKRPDVRAQARRDDLAVARMVDELDDPVGAVTGLTARNPRPATVLTRARMAWTRRDATTHLTATRPADRTPLTDALDTTRSSNPATGRVARLRHRITHRHPLDHPTRTPSPDAAPVPLGPWVVDTHGTTQRPTPRHHAGDSPS